MKQTSNIGTIIVFGITLWAAVLILSVCLLYIYFTGFSKAMADDAFKRENPHYALLGSDSGEGWDGVVYWHFAFRKPGNETVYVEVWCFERQKDGNWKVTSRFTPKE